MKLRYIATAPFFSTLSTEEQERVSERMHLERHRGGEVLFQRGEESHALYLVKSGWIRLTANGGTILASQGPGSLVGETDLFLERPRSLGAATASDSELWILTRDDLVDLIAENPKTGINLALAFGARLSVLDSYLVEHRLRQLAFFGDLDEETLVSISRQLKPVEVRRDQFIVEAGQQPEALFIVETGLVHLQSSEEGGDFSELVSGETFGEMALLTGKPHAHSALAASDVALWALPAAEFEALTDRHSAIRLALSQNIREPLAGDDKMRAADRLSSMPLFAGLSEDARWAVVDRMLLRHVPAGELVFSEGTPGDALYLIDSGQVEIVSQERREGSVLARLSANEFFGEMALLTGKPRSTAARAATHTNLWVLYRSDFDDLVNRHPSISLALSRALSERLSEMDRRFTQSHLRGLKLLSGLSIDQLEDVSRRLKPVRYRQGETIIREGAQGDEMYFLESGRVQVVRRQGARALLLAELGAGDVVGEMALLTGKPRSATVSAVSDVDLWAMSQADFDELLAAHPNLALALSRLLSERLQATDAHFLSEAATQEPVPVSETVTARVLPADERRREPALTAPARPVRKKREKRPARTGVARPRRKPLQTLSTGVRQAFTGTAVWFGSLSRGARVRLILLSLLLVWLTCIAAPALVISTLAAENVTDLRGVIAFVQSDSPQPDQATVADAHAKADVVAATPAAAAPIQALDAQARILRAEPLMEADAAELQLSEPLMSLSDQDTEPVAVPPTATPYVIVVTNTPLPPTATPTPTATPVPPTPTPTRTRSRNASDSSAPQATATAARTQHPPRDLDPRLPALNVSIAEPSGLSPGQRYFRLISFQWQNKEESGNDHTIYIDVFDENGSRMVGQSVEIQWPQGSLIVPVEDKPPPEYGANFPMYGVLGSYNVSIPGTIPSDTAVGLGMGTPEQPSFTIHTNFLLKFQLVRW